jgi:hypothetical protein
VAAELSCDWHTVNDAVCTYGGALLAADRKRLNRTTAIGLDETSFVKLSSRRHQREQSAAHSARIRRSTRSGAEAASARKFNVTVTQEPAGPRSTNRPRQHEVIPKVEQVVDVDEKSDVLGGTLSQDLFVHPGAISTVIKVVFLRRSAPTNVQWKLDNPGCLGDRGVIYILG